MRTRDLQGNDVAQERAVPCRRSATASKPAAWRGFDGHASGAIRARVALAEARIGAELKAAQERGEVATQANGRPISVGDADTYPATLPDLGIPSQRAPVGRPVDASWGAARYPYSGEGRKPL
jgi:hypothetical protein